MSQEEGCEAGGAKQHKVNPLPEITQAVVETMIAVAVCDARNLDDAIFGPNVPRMYVAGEVVDGILIATFAQMVGLENPTPSEIFAAADEYLGRFMQKAA
jgi:hypothetical protein